MNYAAEEITHFNKLLARAKVDKTRPLYHFSVPFQLGFPADPNAMFFANGKYHLMFVYKSREDSYRWGHAISYDMLHWHFLSDALKPDDTDGGIYSGGVYLAEDGKATVAYWALGKDGAQGGIRIAESYPPLYEKWQKIDGYALASSELGVAEIVDENGDSKLIACADPSNIWKCGDKFYMQLGNLCLLDKFRNDENADQSMRGDFTDLLASEDMRTWKYMHRFYDRFFDNRYTLESEDDMCPYFGQLPSGKEAKHLSDKYIQLFLSHNSGTQYYIGSYDQSLQKFMIEKHGRMCYTDNCLFAPEVVRAQDGRLISFFWQRDNIDDDLNREMEKGWSGVYSLPRELYLKENGELGIAPLREIRKQRLHKQVANHILDSEHEIKVEHIDCCELLLTVKRVESGTVGIKLYLNGCAESYVKIGVDFDKSIMFFDLTKSRSLGRKVLDISPLKFEHEEFLELNVFVDQCVVDVFINDIQAISRQVFDIKPGYRQVAVYGGIKESASIEIYDIMPTSAFSYGDNYEFDYDK